MKNKIITIKGKKMSLIDIKENNNNIVKKCNSLVFGKYKLSKSARKIVSILISQINTKDKKFHRYCINVKDFKELVNLDNKDTYKYTHSIITELLSNPIKIGDLQANWISSGEYKKGNSYIEFEISEKLKPFLLELKENFLKYDLKNVLQLNSNYSIKLFELLKQKHNEHLHYKKNQTETNFNIELKELREILQVPKSYKYFDIKKQILEYSMVDFEKNADIVFSYRVVKLGRSVNNIVFTINKNEK